MVVRERLFRAITVTGKGLIALGFTIPHSIMIYGEPYANDSTSVLGMRVEMTMTHGRYATLFTRGSGCGRQVTRNARSMQHAL